jgi:hypothetical protein
LIALTVPQVHFLSIGKFSADREILPLPENAPDQPDESASGGQAVQIWRESPNGAQHGKAFQPCPARV